MKFTHLIVITAPATMTLCCGWRYVGRYRLIAIATPEVDAMPHFAAPCQSLWNAQSVLQFRKHR